jgi:hypothetical protein
MDATMKKKLLIGETAPTSWCHCLAEDFRIEKKNTSVIINPLKALVYPLTLTPNYHVLSIPNPNFTELHLFEIRLKIQKFTFLVNESAD